MFTNIQHQHSTVATLGNLTPALCVWSRHERAIRAYVAPAFVLSMCGNGKQDDKQDSGGSP